MYPGFQKLVALSPTTAVYPGHEYTLANYRFCVACEPRNQALAAITVKAQAAVDAGRPTIPTTIGDELATNVFLRTA